MPGRRLTSLDRRRIAEGLADGHTYAAIARRIGRPTSTVTREVMRNGGPNDYRPARAQRPRGPQARRGDASVGRPKRPSAQRPGGPNQRAVEQLTGLLAEALVRTGMSRMPARVLAALYITADGRLGSADLVARLRVSPASISKAVGFLEEQKLIRRERDPRGRAERYVSDEDAWHQAALASARINIDLANVALSTADALGGTTPAGVRMANVAGYLTRLSEEAEQSAERWRRVYFPIDPAD